MIMINEDDDNDDDNDNDYDDDDNDNYYYYNKEIITYNNNNNNNNNVFSGLWIRKSPLLFNKPFQCHLLETSFLIVTWKGISLTCQGHVYD